MSRYLLRVLLLPMASLAMGIACGGCRQGTNANGDPANDSAKADQTNKTSLEFDWKRDLPIDSMSAGIPDDVQTFGGTEARALVGFPGVLYGALGHWSDSSQGDPSLPGAQLVVKTSAMGPWKLVKAEQWDEPVSASDPARRFFAVGAMIGVTFTTDAGGVPLPTAVSTLIASVWDRNGEGGSKLFFANPGEETLLTGSVSLVDQVTPQSQIRSFGVYQNKNGATEVFLGSDPYGIFRGVYDPDALGKVRWQPEPWDTTPAANDRVMGFATCNGKLYATVRAAVYEREVDATSGQSRWKLLSKLDGYDEPKWSGFRGPTAISVPGTTKEQLLLALEGNPLRMYRFDPERPAQGFVLESINGHDSISDYLASIYQTPVHYGIAAYNAMTSFPEPDGGTDLLMGVELVTPDAPRRLPNAAFGAQAHYLIRHPDGSYESRLITDREHPADMLTSTRTMVRSPFPDDPSGTIYAAGFDANSLPVHNSAWLYRGTLRTAHRSEVVGELGFGRDPAFQGPANWIATDNPMLSWDEAALKLDSLVAMGGNTLFLWAPFEHPQDAVDTIPAWEQTPSGVAQIDLPILRWNQLNLHAKDYLTPDPRRGDLSSFKRLIDAAHKKGIRVISHLPATCESPNTLYVQDHPDWLLSYTVNGETHPAPAWPWGKDPWGYCVDKSNPDLINYLVDTVISHWVLDWGVDGVFLDSPPTRYCPAEIESACDSLHAKPGYECLAPVSGFHDEHLLPAAIRAKLATLEQQTGRGLSFVGEVAGSGWNSWPTEGQIEMCTTGESGPPARKYTTYEMGKFFEYVWDYGFQQQMQAAFKGALTSAGYAQFFQTEYGKDAQLTSMARFLDIVNGELPYLPLLSPGWLPLLSTLQITAPGNITWLGQWQWMPVANDPRWCGPVLDHFGIAHGPNNIASVCQHQVLDSTASSAILAQLISLKSTSSALESDFIEDALVSSTTSGVVAFNRWSEEGSVTVVANLTDHDIPITLSTRLTGTSTVDLFSGASFPLVAGQATLTAPAYSASSSGVSSFGVLVLLQP
jgi:hypothetical protein